MRIIGCDLHARQQTLAMLDDRDRRSGESHADARRQPGAGVLFRTSAPGAGGHRSHWTHAVVFGSAGAVGNRMPGGRRR